MLTDPFDYDAEDRLDRRLARGARRRARRRRSHREPGYGLAYSGPGGRPRSSDRFVE